MATGTGQNLNDWRTGAELKPGPTVRFTKYLTTILRLSYDNATVTINLRRTSS